MEAEYLQFSQFYGKHVHLGVTGSVAAFKSLEICRELFNYGIEASVTLTKAASNFITAFSFESLGASPVYREMFSRQNPTFAHLEPSESAQAFLIAPATANSIAKLAHGLADDMLSCQALAFSGPILLAPAMNPHLWSATATQENLHKISARGDLIISPQQGRVACGHTGQGKMSTVPEIVFRALRAVSVQDMKDQNVLITLGATREYFDPVRFWSNPSSGKMGAALAVAAWLRGADVHCICGNNQTWLPEGIASYPVSTAKQMYEKTLELWPKSDMACLCAAVSDYRPEEFLTEKWKKQTNQQNQDFLDLRLVSNPDILRTLGERKNNSQKLIGFAAESDIDLYSPMQYKLDRKNLDLIVSNRIDQADVGFGSNKNQVQLLDKDLNYHKLPVLNKADIAWKIWDWILKI